jgi:hypothetical protein
MADTPDEHDQGDIDAVDVVETEEEPRSGRASWAKRYPPLVSTLVAVLIALVVLPSSLNLPQTNPTQTLEYAPVPPEKSDDPPPPQGNLSSLGLAGSSSLDGGDGAVGGDDGGVGDGGPDAPGTTLPPKLGDGVGETPSEYRCVGNPPRQTEDPLSPPCVAYFDGDNFGATYQGVTEDEIRIVLYLDGAIGTVGTSRGQETCPKNTLIDLVNDPPKQDECHEVRVSRIWQAYFNQRYQTYDRYVHFFIYFGTSVSNTTPETRRADAAEVYRRVQPFATLDFSSFEGGGDAFVDTLAKRGVLNFGSFLGQDARFFQRYPKLIWGFAPSLEIQSDQYSTVLCNKYVGKPVDHSPQHAGEARKFGLVYTTDPGFETLRRFKDRVMEKFNACGGTLATDPRTFPKAGYAKDTETSSRYALEAMQAFQSAGVTTVIWPGGLETNFSAAAKQLNYYPEWIVAGDGETDNQFAQQGYSGSHGNDRDVWQYANVVSFQAQMPQDETDRVCFQAQRSVDPNVPTQDALRAGCDKYDNLRQLFIGIQVAGPRLTPTSIDRGFHAIPAIPSPSLQIPSCYYDEGDYTCVKDFVIGRWDPQGNAEERGGAGTSQASPGCYRIVGNRRIVLADVDKNNAMFGYRPLEDECLNFGTGLQQNIGPPDPNEI